MKTNLINKFYDPAAGNGAGGAIDPKEFKENFLKELGTIKSALETNLTKKAEEREKNFQDKLDEVNATIETLKAVKPEVTAEELKTLKADMDVTIKAFDKLQDRIKKEGMKGPGTSQKDESFGGRIAKAIEDNRETIANETMMGKSIKEQKMTMKAVGDMTVMGNTNGVPSTYRTGMVPMPFEMVHLRNLVSVTPSDTDSYHFFRHATTGEGAITWQGNENGTKAQIDEDLVEVTVNLDYLAGFLIISRKMLRNFKALQAYLAKWLPEKYYQAEDTKGYQYILANATGVQDTSGTDMISQIIRTIGKQKKARYNVNGIVIDGEVWGKILTYKGVTSGEFTQPIGVVTITSSGQLLICGIPVYVASWVGGAEAIIADWNMLEIIQSESLSMGFFEQDGTNVQKNKITVRIEASIAFAMLDTKAFVVAQLESVS